MTSGILKKALSILNGYLIQNYNDDALKVIGHELEVIADGDLGQMKEIDADSGQRAGIKNKSDDISYREIQEQLSCLNEKEPSRKNKGVYYTPSDVVSFILTNSVKLACGCLKPEKLSEMALEDMPYDSFCFEKTIYDPTCGTGVFLLAALELKFNLLDIHDSEMKQEKLQAVVASVRGNDLNKESIVITKMRLFLCVLHRYGVNGIRDLGKVLNDGFTCFDFVTMSGKADAADGIGKFDMIIGNPPYVEDSKSESVPQKKYGNIYANVLANAALHLKCGGVLGFVIPLSYVSTPRMKKIRNELYHYVPEQYILSYSDRPDCLFTSVHQKLCIFIAGNKKIKETAHTDRMVNVKEMICQTPDDTAEKILYTSNYKYWYREEREKLFTAAGVVKNDFSVEEYIPKLGSEMDVSIYGKVMEKPVPLMDMLDNKRVPVYLNMRAAFWIKAFLGAHSGGEYRMFGCESAEYAGFCMCLLNSSLFWWYWVCVSDCWHITGKELRGFKAPFVCDFRETDRLAQKLEKRLEETKLYVGTKQTAYEYKHKECVKEIHQIDDYINHLYGLTEAESLYIKNFALRYRVSGGVNDGGH